MKILYLITKSNWGGAQRHVFDLSVAMKNSGHDVWVALGGEGILKQKLESAGIYTFSVQALERDISIKKEYASFKEIISILKDKKPDVLHLHSPKAAGLGSLAGRLMRTKKIITTVHGWTFNEDRGFFQKLIIAFVSWITMLLSHTTILISERDYKQAEHFPWSSDKIKLIPLGIKSPTFISIEGAKQNLAKLIGMPIPEWNKKIIVGTIAELHPNKGLNYLLDSMKIVCEQHPNTIGVIVGDGQDRNALELQIKSNGLTERVFLAGYLDNAAEYMKAFTIFTLSSKKEGLPYVILEAGAASLPVVGTTVGGIPEIVEDMKSGILVQPRNSRELGHAISFMIEHPEERKKYGAALKERVTTRFALDRMIWLIEGLYKISNQPNTEIAKDAEPVTADQ